MTAPSTKIINVILPDANLSGSNQTPSVSKATINIFSDGTLQT